MQGHLEASPEARGATDWLRGVSDAHDPVLAMPEGVLDWLAALSLPAAPWPPDLVGRPSARTGLEHHRHSLMALVEAKAAGPTDLARAAYHARWLHHLLVPEDPDGWPTVCVVIPLYNSADYVADCIRSCLAQTHPRLEILVVDDGSTDDPDRVLLPFREQIRLLRKPNAGCASARNMGIAATKADFVHFLDSDDLLEPDAVARKLTAFRAVPDADLCCTPYSSTGYDGHRDVALHQAPPIGDELCPTRDLLTTAVRRYPFSTITLMLPRWVLLATGRMDESLKTGSDARYWFQLGLSGAKAIALRTPLSLRRFRQGSLTSSADDHHRSWALTFLLNLSDLLARPRHWTHVGQFSRKMQGEARWRLLHRLDDDQADDFRERLLSQISEMARSGRLRGLSPRVPLLLIEEHVPASGYAGLQPHEEDRFRTRLLSALGQAIAAAPPPAAADLHFWTRCNDVGRAFLDHRNSARAFRRFVEEILIEDPACISLEELSEQMTEWPDRLGLARRWRRAARLSRWLGVRGALGAASGIQLVADVSRPLRARLRRRH